MLPLITLRKIWYTLSGLAAIASVVVFILWGLNLGIDFTGGSLMEIQFSVDRPSNQEVMTALEPLQIGTVQAQPIGDHNMILRFKDIDQATHQKILDTLKTKFAKSVSGGDGVELGLQVLEEQRFDSIGPTIGQELKQKTLWAIGFVITAIVVYIAWAFRKVSKPVASWKYGLSAVVALFHDVMITVGVFCVLGKLYNMEVNAPFIAALLTVLGYSVNDTIVVFDRTRENLTKRMGEDFEKIVQDSVNQTLVRSLNASMTTLLSLFALLLFGGASIRDFALTLIIGISIGTYSSIFLASPLLVTWERFRSRS